MIEDETTEITGLVVNIVDGDTIDIDVTHVNPVNKHTYRSSERIRIYGRDAPELDTLEGLREREQFKDKLLGQEITLFTRLRDKNGRIVARIKGK